VRKTASSILSDEEVDAVSEATLAFLRSGFGDHPFFTRPRLDAIARHLPLARRCAEAREARGLSFKDVSRDLGIPQYRLRAVESAGSQELRLDVLRKYVAFLGLQRWYARWSRANSALVASLEQDTETGQRRPKPRGPERPRAKRHRDEPVKTTARRAPKS
jgi:hypothetical protein